MEQGRRKRRTLADMDPIGVHYDHPSIMGGMGATNKISVVKAEWTKAPIFSRTVFTSRGRSSNPVAAQICYSILLREFPNRLTKKLTY
jgi:hypothetical protein